MTFQIDGEEHVAPAGSFVFVPRGVLHSFWNAGTEPATQLTMITPSGIEDYFDALGALRAAGEVTPEALAALRRRCGARKTTSSMCPRTVRRTGHSTRSRPGLEPIARVSETALYETLRSCLKNDRF